MLRKIVILVAFLLCVFSLNAQEQGNMKLKIEAGFDLEKPGLFLNVEPKVKSTENTVIGLRFGVIGYSGTNTISTLNTQTTIHTTGIQYIINEKSGNGIISFVPTFDYYLNENIFLNRHFFRPYLGLGVGYYVLGTYIEVSEINTANSTEDEIEGRVSNQPGILFRGGIELDKLIIGLEYNFIPKADIKLPNGQTIGIVDLSFIGMSFGFALELGKSSK